MPTDQITLPCGRIVNVFSATGKCGYAGQYFNGKRIGYLPDIIRDQYHRHIPALQAALVDEIVASEMIFDAVVSPPSSNDDARPYMTAILGNWPVPDLSAAFVRNGKWKAAHTATTVQHLVNEEYVHTADGSESDTKTILIVDDSVASGKTASAIIELLIRAGLPKSATVALAVCSNMNI